MKINEVMAELKEFGSESTKHILSKHGATEPFFGVKVGDLKKIQQKIRGDHELALELYKTDNSDAMYLAGLVADGSKMNKTLLRKWARKARWYMLSEYTIPAVAADNRGGWELALEWIDAEKEALASSGWTTLTAIISKTPDDKLDLKTIRELLNRIGSTIHDSDNRVRYTMNGFVIAVATYVVELHEEARRVAEKNGKIEVEMGGTACKVPFAPDYIKKIKERGGVGKKRAAAKK